MYKRERILKYILLFKAKERRERDVLQDSTSATCLQKPVSCVSLRAKVQLATPYETTAKLQFLYILIYRFPYWGQQYKRTEKE
jgi:hypothetical protein